MEEQEGDFSEMLNKMKIIEHRQRKDQTTIKQIFNSWRGEGRADPYRRHHNMVLYCKVIKGFMINQMQMSAFAQKLENVYIGMLMRTHFDAMREYRDAMAAEREGKARFVRLRWGLRRAVGRMRECLMLKREGQGAKEEVDRVYKVNLKTDQQFYQQREMQPSAARTHLSRPLEDSRRSAYSAFSANSDFPSRKKFTTVKPMPSRPNLQSIVESDQSKVEDKSGMKEDRRRGDNIQEEKREEMQTMKDIPPEKGAYVEEKTDNEAVVTEVQQSPKKNKKGIKNKERILSLLSRLKILELNTIDQIITEYSSNLKSQSLLNQQNYRQLNRTTVKKIMSLE